MMAEQQRRDMIGLRRLRRQLQEEDAEPEAI